MQSSWEYLGVVDDHYVVFFEILDDILELLVFDRLFFAVKNHQSSAVSRFGRVFRDNAVGIFVNESGELESQNRVL